MGYYDKAINGISVTAESLSADGVVNGSISSTEKK